MIMWSAVILRILENGSTRSPGQGSTAGAATAGARGWGLGAGETSDAPRSITPSMSCLVTRPAKPVPGIVEMSTRCSAAILRTSGVDLRRKRSSAVSTPPSPFPTTGAVEGGRGREGAVADGGETAVPPGAAGARWAAATGGAASSASTLSVEISNSGSSRFTSSPSFLSHLLKVPSAIDSPIWGMRTSTRAIESPSVRREPSCGLHDIVSLGQHEIFQGRRIWQRHVVRRHPHDRAVQPREGLLVDARGDLARQPTGARVLVYDEHLVGLLHRPHDRGVIHRQQRPEVEDFDRETVVLRQLVGRLERLPHRGPVGDDGQVLPLAGDPRLADGGEDLLLFRQRLLDPAVQPFVLEVDDRIVVPDGGLDQALRVPRGGGIDDLQARRVKEGRLRVLRMERTAPHVAASGAAHDHRGRETGAVARGGDVVREHVVGAGDEVDELHLRHRAHAHVGRPGGGADDGRLRYAVTTMGGNSSGRRSLVGGRFPSLAIWNTTGSRTRQRTAVPLRRAGLNCARATAVRAAVAKSECVALTSRTDGRSARPLVSTTNSSNASPPRPRDRIVSGYVRGTTAFRAGSRSTQATGKTPLSLEATAGMPALKSNGSTTAIRTGDPPERAGRNTSPREPAIARESSILPADCSITTDAPST